MGDASVKNNDEDVVERGEDVFVGTEATTKIETQGGGAEPIVVQTGSDPSALIIPEDPDAA